MRLSTCGPVSISRLPSSRRLPPSTFLALAARHREGLAGHQRFVHRAAPGDDAAVDGDGLALAHEDAVVRAHLVERTVEILAAAQHAGARRPGLQDGLERFGGARAGAALEVAADGDDHDQRAGHLEIEVDGAVEELDDAVAVGREDGQGEQDRSMLGRRARRPIQAPRRIGQPTKNTRIVVRKNRKIGTAVKASRRIAP
jgi:hypothetical protein